MFEDGQDKSDYHNTINGDKFTAWVRHRLIPAFQALFPGKRMVLVMDNAGYHKARDETWISTVKSQSRHDLAHTLLDLGVTELTDAATGAVYPAHRFASNRGTGPSKDALLAAVRKVVEERPGCNRTVVEQLLDAEQYSIIYTPPYSPDLQPIELLWAYVKNRVARKSRHGRSLTECRQQAEDAFESVTPMLCAKLIAHTHSWMDAFLQSDAAEDLAQCGSLAGVIQHLPLLQAKPAPPSIIPTVAAHAAPTAAVAAASSSCDRSRSARRRRAS